MSAKWAVVALAGVAAAGVFAGNVLATPSNGLTATPIATKIAFDSFDVKSHTMPADTWQTRLRAHGESDAYVVGNRLAPGGTTGWHSHPGPSLVMVVEGTITNYSSDHPGCAGVEYPQGTGFVDEGGDHVHMLRNETDVPAATVATQILPRDATRRVDKPTPEGCQP